MKTINNAELVAGRVVGVTFLSFMMCLKQTVVAAVSKPTRKSFCPQNLFMNRVLESIIKLEPS